MLTQETFNRGDFGEIINALNDENQPENPDASRVANTIRQLLLYRRENSGLIPEKRKDAGNRTGAQKVVEKSLPQSESDSHVLNFAQRGQIRSKARRNLTSVIDVIYTRLSAGEPVSENTFDSGRYRADALRAMRIIARCYPGITRLEIEGGIWVLRTVRP